MRRKIEGFHGGKRDIKSGSQTGSSAVRWMRKGDVADAQANNLPLPHAYPQVSMPASSASQRSGCGSEGRV